MQVVSPRHFIALEPYGRTLIVVGSIFRPMRFAFFLDIMQMSAPVSQKAGTLVSLITTSTLYLLVTLRRALCRLPPILRMVGILEYTLLVLLVVSAELSSLLDAGKSDSEDCVSSSDEGLSEEESPSPTLLDLLRVDFCLQSSAPLKCPDFPHVKHEPLLAGHCFPPSQRVEEHFLHLLFGL